MPRTVVYREGGFTNCGIGYTKFSQEELAERRDRSMTENEAIKELETSIDLAKMCTQNYERKNEIQGYEMAIKALEEVQQYRKHGVTVESALNNMCDLTAAENLIEEYRTIGTPEECRVAVEKQTAKKVKSISPVKDGDSYVGLIGRCPCCGDILEEDTVYCDCGQRLDWGNEE